MLIFPPYMHKSLLTLGVLFSTGFTSLSVILLFPLSITFLVIMCGFWFYFIQLEMCLSLETLTSIIRTGWPILVELIDLVNFVIILNNLTQIVNFPTWIPDCDSLNPALLDLFLLMLVFVLQWLSLHWEILIMLLSQFPLTFQ